MNQIGSEGVEALAEVLKSNSTLQELNLFCNQAGDDGAIALAQALKSNSTLINLDLTDNHITSKGIDFIAQSLKSNSALRKIYLRANAIGDSGVKALAQAFKSNSTIEELDLGECVIQDAGFGYLAEVLKTNSTIKFLSVDLNYNDNDDWICYLSDALKSNLALKSLKLDLDWIEDRGFDALLLALKSNYSLLNIPTQNLEIENQKKLDDLKELMTRNKTLDDICNKIIKGFSTSKHPQQDPVLSQDELKLIATHPDSNLTIFNKLMHRTPASNHESLIEYLKQFPNDLGIAGLKILFSSFKLAKTKDYAENASEKLNLDDYFRLKNYSKKLSKDEPKSSPSLSTMPREDEPKPSPSLSTMPGEIGKKILEHLVGLQK